MAGTSCRAWFSAGLWRSVSLEVLPATRFGDVYLATMSADPANNRADLLADWQSSPTSSTSMIACGADPPPRHRGRSPVQLPGHLHPQTACASQSPTPVCGGPAATVTSRYTTPNCALVDAAGAVLATRCCRLGLRTLKLVRRDISATNPGEFVFMVNGHKTLRQGQQLGAAGPPSTAATRSAWPRRWR